MRGIATAVVMVVCAWTGEAMADAYYFEWHCQGPCSEGSLGADGIDGPYSDEGSCEQARNQRGFEVNTNGNAGRTSACYSSDGGGAGGSGGGGGSGAPVRPARVARANVVAVYGGAWTFDYANGSHADSGATAGGAIAVTFGHEKLGLDLSLGALRAAGPTPPIGEAEVLWVYDLSLGFASSPFAIVRRPGLEVRPELGLSILDQGRVSCERCTTDPADIFAKPEASSGFGYRLRAGLDLWLGRRRASGLALEAIYQKLEMTEDVAVTDPLAGTSAHLTAPTVLFRLSFLRRGADFAAY